MRKNIVLHCSRCGNETSRTYYVKDRKGNRCKNIFCSNDCYQAFRAETRKARGNKCLFCEKAIDSPGSNSDAKFCSVDCRVSLGVKNCLIECGICKVQFSAIKWRASGGYARDKTRKLCSKECISVFMKTDKDRKLKTAHHGSDHPNWNGGSHRGGSRGSGWQSIAEICRDLHGRVCKKCGKTEQQNGRRLDVNHIIPFHQHRNKTKSNMQSNLEALCRSCHKATDWQWRKDNHVQICLDIFS